MSIKPRDSTMEKSNITLKRKVAPNDTVESPAITMIKQNTYRLEREKASLQAKVKLMKKELSVLRAQRRESEFDTLQDPDRQEEIYPELSENIELWKKYTGFDFDRVSYLNDDSKNWFLHGSADGLPFRLSLSFKKDESSNRGCIDKCLLEIMDACRDEIQPHLDTKNGNVEQIFKILKVYYQSYKQREQGLKECKETYGDLINVTQDDGTVIEISTTTTFYFKITWKLAPSFKHFAKMKNVCRLSSTKEGDEYIKSNADISTIKKELNSSPLEVIRLLARGIADL